MVGPVEQLRAPTCEKLTVVDFYKEQDEKQSFDVVMKSKTVCKAARCNKRKYIEGENRHKRI